MRTSKAREAQAQANRVGPIDAALDGRSDLIRPVSIFWSAAWMTVMIVAVKGSYVGLATFWKWATSPWDYASWLYLQWFAAAAQADTLFALGAAAIGALLVSMTRRNGKAARAIAGAFLAFGMVCVIYAVVSRQTFSYYSAPLTYQLLRLGGEPAKMWSSLEGFVTPGAVFTIAALPAAYLAIVFASRKLDSLAGPRARAAIRGGLLLIVGGWLALGQQLVNSNWFLAQDRYFKDSAHKVFVESLLLSFVDSGSVLGTVRLEEEDFSDFRPTPTSVQYAGARTGGFPRNVILIVLESVGVRYLSLYGSRLNTTPRLRHEQDHALVFDRYYAPVGWTAYSMLSLVMAQRPPMERYNELSFRAATLRGPSVAKVLADAGFRTIFMSAGDPDWASAGFLEESGFAEVLRGKDLVGAKQVSSWGTQDRFLFDAMLGRIDQLGDRPFFLMAWTDQTHHPYKVAQGQQIEDVLAHEEKKAMPDLANYTSLIREADAQIGRLLDGLRQRGMAEDTLVIITGDHGEAFGEPHGGSGHGFTVYDEEVRVPLVLWSLKFFGKGKRVPTVGSHTDLAPTILDLLGIAAPAEWVGRSLFDPSRPGRTYLFAAAWGQYLLGVCTGEFKYIHDARMGTEELYDLRVDPDELRNVAVSNPQRADEFRRRLAAWVTEEQGRSADRREVATR